MPLGLTAGDRDVTQLVSRPPVTREAGMAKKSKKDKKKKDKKSKKK
ncbi:hypothetical protein AB0F72_39795 [Actinoplanes sp. NPDC023936]